MCVCAAFRGFFSPPPPKTFFLINVFPFEHPLRGKKNSPPPLPAAPLNPIDGDALRFAKLAAAGGLAGAVSRTATAPLDRVRVLCSLGGTGSRQRLGVRGALRLMRAEGEGARAYFRGNGVNVLKNVPESALKLAVNDRGQRAVLAREREKVAAAAKGGGGGGGGGGGEGGGGVTAATAAEQQQQRRLTVAERLAIGGAAGGVAQIIIYPLEVIQTRLAAPASLVSHPHSSGHNGHSHSAGYRGIVDCALKIYKQEGPRAFGRGLLPTVLGILPYAGVDIATFELLKERLMDGNRKAGKEEGAKRRSRPRRGGGGGGGAGVEKKKSSNSIRREEWGGAWWWDDAAPPPPSVYGDAFDVDGEDDGAEQEGGMAAAAAAAAGTSTPTPAAKTTPPAVALLGAGVVSSAVAQAFAYPLGLVRTRLQVDGAGGRPRVYSSMRHCFSEVRLFFFLSLFFFRFFRVFCLSLPKTCPNKTRKNVQYRSSRERAREGSTRASPPTS